MKQDIRQTTTPVIQQSGMSGTLMSMEPRAKTVHGDEDRVPMLCFAYVHLGANALLILAKHLPFPRQRIDGRNRRIAGNSRGLAQSHKRFCAAGRTVAVNDESRIRLQNQEGSESRCKLHRNRCSSDIPGNVAPQVLSGHTQRMQLARHERASVVAGQKE